VQVWSINGWMEPSAETVEGVRRQRRREARKRRTKEEERMAVRREFQRK